MSGIKEEIEKNKAIGGESDSNSVERLQDFQTTFSYNEEEVRKFKRWKKRVSLLDKIGGLSGIVGIFIFLLVSQFEDSLSSTFYEGGAGLSVILLGIFVLLGCISIVHTIAIWNKDLSSDSIAAYDLSQAWNEYSRGESYETDTVVHHLKEAKTYLSSANKHDLIAPNHSEAIEDYVSDVTTAKSPNRAISRTFPKLMEITVFAFSDPNSSQINKIGKSIESDPTHSPSKLEEIKEDCQSLAQFFFASSIGPLLVATTFGIITWVLFGPWRGATVSFGIITVYSLLHNRFDI